MSSNKINIRQKKSAASNSNSDNSPKERPKVQIKPKSAYPGKPNPKSKAEEFKDYVKGLLEKFSGGWNQLINQRYGKYMLWGGVGLLGIGILLVSIISLVKQEPAQSDKIQVEDNTFKASDPSKGFYGIDTSKYQILEQGAFLAGESPFDVLIRKKTPQSQIDQIQMAMENPLQLTTPYPASRYTMLGVKGGQTPDLMVIEPTDFEYWIWKLSVPARVEKIERMVERRQESLAMIITGNLRKSLSRNIQLASELETHIEEALSWQVDLYHLEPGTKLKVIYDITYVDGEIYSIDNMPAIWLENKNSTYTAYYFDKEPYKGYYDMNAQPMKTTFLKAPVKYSSISSTFGTRFHPLEEREKFHYGTDYAAKAGSPIYAVADGEVLAATVGDKSGYYVQLRHNDGYQTFYLHMQKNSFPEGIRKGSTVKQGDIIGMVGATGSATGPHVCFHIRKDAKPIDPLSVGLPGREPLPSLYVLEFMTMRDTINQHFDQLTLFQ